MSELSESTHTWARLNALGMPFAVHSPHSDLEVNPPYWWNGKKNDSWVIEAFDHQKRARFAGSGKTLAGAESDLLVAIRKAVEVTKETH